MFALVGSASLAFAADSPADRNAALAAKAQAVFSQQPGQTFDGYAVAMATQVGTAQSDVQGGATIAELSAANAVLKRSIRPQVGKQPCVSCPVTSRRIAHLQPVPLVPNPQIADEFDEQHLAGFAMDMDISLAFCPVENHPMLAGRHNESN
jgi:hypothetical protein